MNADLAKFAGLDAQVVGISVDSVYCHIAWQEKALGWLGFPLCCDYYPHGEVAAKYGVLRTGDPIPGITERAIFIINKQGKVAFSHVYDLGEQPENQDILDELKKL